MVTREARHAANLNGGNGNEVDLMVIGGTAGVYARPESADRVTEGPRADEDNGGVVGAWTAKRRRAAGGELEMVCSSWCLGLTTKSARVEVSTRTGRGLPEVAGDGEAVVVTGSRGGGVGWRQSWLLRRRSGWRRWSRKGEEAEERAESTSEVLTQGDLGRAARGGAGRRRESHGGRSGSWPAVLDLEVEGAEVRRRRGSWSKEAAALVGGKAATRVGGVGRSSRRRCWVRRVHEREREREGTGQAGFGNEERETKRDGERFAVYGG